MQRIREFVEDDDIVFVGKDGLFAVFPLLTCQFLSVRSISFERHVKPSPIAFIGMPSLTAAPLFSEHGSGMLQELEHFYSHVPAPSA